MSKIALSPNSSGTGTFTIASPNSNTNRTLTLPDETGTVLTNATSIFVSYALLWEEQTSTTDGGTFTSGDYRTRTLNQETDPDGIVTLSSNQFTLGAGTYLIKWSAPAYQSGRHGTLLRNITDSTNSYGSAEYTDAAYGGCSRSFGAARVTIASSKVFEIWHRAQTTAATYGLGVGTDFQPEIYTIVEIYKEA